MLLHNVRTVFSLAAMWSLSACGGAPDVSTTEERATVENPRHVTAAAAQAFIDHYDDILASATGRGQLEVGEFLSIMPMADDQRQIILRNYTTPFEVTCQGDFCSAIARGRPVDAVMDISLNGVSDPTLELEDAVITGMTRRVSGVEFCNVEGMWARKFFMRRPVQGILMALRAQGPELTVNVDYDSQNFECD